MADINNIQNAETGLSVRAKLNEVIARINAQGGETLTPDNVEIYNPNKIGGYLQGAIIAYSSATVGFETPELYRALFDIPSGQSPESHPAKWFNEGDEFEIVTSNTATSVVQSLAELRAIKGMKTSDTIIVNDDGFYYRFDELIETGEKPNDGSDGSWVKRNSFSGGGHSILDENGDLVAQADALQFRNGHTVTSEAGKTVVDVDAEIVSHVDGVDEEKHGANQITNAAALPNIESAAAAKQSVINGNINARLFEQIAFVLSGYDIDVTTDSQDILKALPYAFKAYEIRAEFATAPTGSSATVTFYKNGVSIGTTSIASGTFSGTAILSPVVSFAKGDSLSAVVTQIGSTIPGATAKAYIQGIKYQ